MEQLLITLVIPKWIIEFGRNRSAKSAICIFTSPNYDSSKAYPLLIWMHGFSQDENVFLDYVVKPFDCAIASGKLPPMIIAAPDGSLNKNYD